MVPDSWWVQFHGSHILSDGWAASYALDQIQDGIYLHDQVIHEDNFVNPDDPDIHTNSVENLFASGSSGYELLIAQGLPYPSVRTLQRLTQGVEFEPGLQEEIFNLLQLKVSTMSDEDKLCVLGSDEMRIKESCDFDNTSDSFIGKATLTDHQDPPHLVKNLRMALQSGQSIVIPESFTTKWGLSQPFVKMAHIEELLAFDTGELKLCPEINAKIMSPNHFQKMSVSEALKIISHATASGLRYLSTSKNDASILTTATFIDKIRTWFDFMTSRDTKMALSKSNPEAYQRAIAALEEIVVLARSLVCGPTGKAQTYQKKPWMNGIILSTSTVLDLRKDLVEEHNFPFILTSWFTNDFVENLFSMLRRRSVTPTPIEVKRNLRAICIAQFMEERKGSSYSYDDGSFLLDMVAELKQYREKNEDGDADDQDDSLLMDFTLDEELNLNGEQLNVLYYVSDRINPSYQGRFYPKSVERKSS
eukprot:snap_masked-scaffold57_size444674-processed-gene-3.26 protein:Tk04374 transcript:snap_masked-scaffold57_size444674-processed-gene-3.26-mRNA-1 annotation:"vam6 vps39-like"